MNFFDFATCEFCKAKTVLFSSINETESKCANGDCAKISKLNRDEMVNLYIKYLEESLTRTAKVCKITNDKLTNLERQSHLVKTNSGFRLAYNEFNSIQWALTENIEHLK